VEKLKRGLFLAAVFTLLLPQLLFSNPFLDDCFGAQLGPRDLRLVSATGYVDVTVSEAKQMIDSSPSLVILDVRTLGEYESRHIQNATLIPVAELASRLSQLNNEKVTLVYCGTGGRSATASQILVDNGFSKVYNMLGGITAWIDAGYPTEIFIGDLNTDGTVNILDIAIVAKAFGTKPGDSNWNPSADLDKNGWINIVDVALVARNYGRTV
jgi:rhodanese-related sulfurtransferase